MKNKKKHFPNTTTKFLEYIILTQFLLKHEYFKNLNNLNKIK